MRDYKEHINELRDAIEPFVDRLILSGALVSLVFSIMVFFGTVNGVMIAIADALFSLTLFIVFAARKKISPKNKILIACISLLVLIILVFYSYGLASNAIILIAALYTVAYIFLPSKEFKILKYTIFTLLSLTLFIRVTNEGVFDHYQTAIHLEHWIFQFLTIGFVMYIIEYTIKVLIDYLVRTNESLKATIEELNDHEKMIKKLAYYDQLTNLPNKELFEKNVNDFIQTSEHGVLLILNLSKMNQINSLFGEHVGDKILLEVGNHLSTRMNNPQRVSRVYGNEFGVFVDNRFIDNLEYYTTEFFEELKMIPSLYEYYHYLEWRVAAVHSYKDGRAFDELFHKANMCLRYAKETQKFNEIIFFSNDIQFDFEKSDVLLKEIELAINKNEFELFVQEKTDTTHNQVVGLEALARWESSLLGPISPGVFIPIIEDNDKSIQFGEMVIRKGLSLIPLIDDKYGEIPLSINISPSHLKSLNFLNYLLEQIEETKVDPKRIEIEITENVLLDDFEYTYDLIKSIQSHGFKVSLDDFGTGFSSLQYLIDLPVNTIKIDRAFIRNIHTDKKQKILVESILRISEANGYSVVAEGVEEKEQVDILNELGCNIVQGYYYSKPEQLNK